MTRKKIIAFGVGAVSAAALTFSPVTSASAVIVIPSTLTETVCAALPPSVSSLLTQVTAATAAVSTTATDLTTKQVALQTAITELIPAVVAHINAVSLGLPSAGTAGVLIDKSNAFVTAVVAENNAMTASFDAQRKAYLTGLNYQYVLGVQTGLCV